MKISKTIRSFFEGKSVRSLCVGSEEGRGFADRPGFRTLLRGALTGVVALSILGGSIVPPQQAQAADTVTDPYAITKSVSRDVEAANDWYEAEYLMEIEAIKNHPAYTEHDVYVAGLHKHFENVVPGMKVIVVPRDMLNRSVWRFAGAEGLSRAEMFEGYVRDRAWEILMPTHIGNTPAHEAYEEVFSGRDAHVWRFVANNFSTAQMNGAAVACVVAPSSPNTAPIDDVAKMMGVLGSSIITVGDTPGVVDISKDEIRRFQDLREISKCFDANWFPKLDIKTGMKKQYTRHLIESFADTAAVLMMAQQGYRDTAGKMAQVRAVGSGMWGTNNVYIKKDGDHNPERLKGAIYATHPVLRATQAFIDKTPPQAFAKMTPREIIGTAIHLTKNYALTDEQFEMLYRGYEQIDRAMNRYANGGLSMDNGIKDEKRASDRRAWLQAAVADIYGEINRSVRRVDDVPYVWSEEDITELRKEIGVERGWLKMLEVMARDAGGTWADQERAITYFQNKERQSIYSDNIFASKKTNTIEQLDNRALTNKYVRVPAPAPDFSGRNLKKDEPGPQ